MAVVLAAAFGPLVRLIATAGDLDPSFGIGGVATAPLPSVYPTAVAVQADGKIVAAGGAGGPWVARFNPDGSLDSGFGADGVTTTRLAFDDRSGYSPFKVLLRPDGRIAVVGQFHNGSGTQATVVQYTPDGTPDLTFGDGGIAKAPSVWRVADAALQADGGVLVVGHAYFGAVEYLDWTVQRFTPDGAMDPAFGTVPPFFPASLVHTDILGQEEAFAIAVQPDGRFVVAGFTNSSPNEPYIVRQFAFARYLPDGTLDASFGTDGKVAIDPAPGVAVESWLWDVLIQPDGRIVGAGYSWLDMSGINVAGTVVRLLSDGQPDTSFSDDGRAIFDDGVTSNEMFRGGIGRLALQSNGRLLAAAGRVLGIRPDGTLDPEFHGDGIAGIPGAPTDITVQDDDKVVITAFPTIPEEYGFRVVRLIAVNTPPALNPAAISVQRGTSPRLTIGTAVDMSDPLANLVVSPIAATVPAGLTFTDLLINATTGVVSAVITPSCTLAPGGYEVQFSITDGGNATTFATVPVEIVVNTGSLLSIGDRTHLEGTPFDTPVVVTVTASGGVCAPITFHYATADGTATAPSDYTARSGTATIAVNQSSTTISIPVDGESFPEPDETFFVNLDSPINATIADAQAVITIQNDDPPFIQFASPNTIEVVETDDPSLAHVVTLALTRLTGLSSPSSVRLSLGGSAQTGTDFLLLSPALVHFAAGQTAAEVRIAIVGDLVEEPTEGFGVEIRDPVNATIGTPSNVNVIIRDDDLVDTTAPVMDGFTSSPNDAGWHNRDVSVRLSASDGASGIKSIAYTLTGAQAAALTVVPAADPANTVRVVIPITTEGITEVTFFAEDVAGNVAPARSLTVRLDKTAPVLVVTSPKERTYTLNEPVLAAYTCTDGGSGVDRCVAQVLTFPCAGSELGFCIEAPEPGAALDTSWIGPRTFSANARDLAGNSTSVQVTYTVNAQPVPPPDVDKPVITGSPSVAANATGWHKDDVSVLLAASDGSGSGVKSIGYALSGAQTSALTAVPGASTAIPIVAEGITVATFFAEDMAGNVSATQSLTVRLDKTAPGVVITSPQARAYTLNEAAAAAYMCTDGVSGVASCSGTTAVGAPIDTTSPGAKTYSATVTDAAGHQSTANVAYTVVMPPPTFMIRTLNDPLKEHNRGSAIPIKLQVENAAGVNVSSAGLMVEAVAVSSGTGIGQAEEERVADDAGQSNPLGRFRFVSDGAYLFNLKTKGLKAGPYVLVVRVAGDTALHAVPFLIREP
jgi:uncharacterized delta-60 repeat protein